jgi:hypothetical protein
MSAPRPILEAPEAFGPAQILWVRARMPGQANFAELWGCPVAVGGLIKNNMNTNWCLYV